jgi:hypothetical protein
MVLLCEILATPTSWYPNGSKVVSTCTNAQCFAERTLLPCRCQFCSSRADAYRARDQTEREREGERERETERETDRETERERQRERETERERERERGRERETERDRERQRESGDDEEGQHDNNGFSCCSRRAKSAPLRSLAELPPCADRLRSALVNLGASPAAQV